MKTMPRAHIKCGRQQEVIVAEPYKAISVQENTPRKNVVKMELLIPG